MTESLADAVPASAESRRELHDIVQRIAVDNPELDTSGTKGRPMIETVDGQFEVRWVPVRK